MPANLAAIRREVRAGRYRVTIHCARRLLKRAISVLDIEFAVGNDDPELLEDYEDDPRGPSCLILGWTQSGEPLHVQIGYTVIPEVITVYRPDPTKWEDNRHRRQGSP